LPVATSASVANDGTSTFLAYLQCVGSGSSTGAGLFVMDYTANDAGAAIEAPPTDAGTNCRGAVSVDHGVSSPVITKAGDGALYLAYVLDGGLVVSLRPAPGTAFTTVGTSQPLSASSQLPLSAAAHDTGALADLMIAVAAGAEVHTFTLPGALQEEVASFRRVDGGTLQTITGLSLAEYGGRFWLAVNAAAPFTRESTWLAQWVPSCGWVQVAPLPILTVRSGCSLLSPSLVASDAGVFLAVAEYCTQSTPESSPHVLRGQ
jgi:hypothetical protein